MIQIDMEMPRSCECCKFSSYHDGDDYCELYKLIHGYAWRAKDVQWDNNCPLKEVSDNSVLEDINKMKQEYIECEVLDKIRAEIENDWQLKKYPSSPFSCGLRRAIEIIDKYKAENEPQESIEKESIPYLMHKKMDIPISECQKAYAIAIEYLRSQGKLKG